MCLEELKQIDHCIPFLLVNLQIVVLQHTVSAAHASKLLDKLKQRQCLFSQSLDPVQPPEMEARWQWCPHNLLSSASQASCWPNELWLLRDGHCSM
jgi:hypothetical protein